ncbi:MnhB domain-containing protein [Salinibaculum rarum]|uniref:MnhB domain-containing protein n=1 Tax=Salinibaculum rarum TaxID=3058903 RepID=UPI0026600C94|nr:MnhB domain-containing protein [Salinibaculum sp. KK48]
MSERIRRPYTESTVIMTTIRILAPFVFTFGLFVMFHGAESAGGGFQGGTIVAAMVFMFAFAFGIEPTRRWFLNTVAVGLVAGGVLVFAGIGLGSIALGGGFLEYSKYPIYHATKYGIEAVELAIGTIVAGIISGLFFAIAHGFDDRRDDE